MNTEIPSGAQVSFNETHVKQDSRYNDDQYAKLTAHELEMLFKPAKSERGKRMYEHILKKVKSEPDPQFPKNKDFRRYRVLKSMIDGHKVSSDHSQETRAESNVDDPIAAEALIEFHNKLSLIHI